MFFFGLLQRRKRWLRDGEDGLCFCEARREARREAHADGVPTRRGELHGGRMSLVPRVLLHQDVVQWGGCGEVVGVGGLTGAVKYTLSLLEENGDMVSLAGDRYFPVIM